MFLCLIVFKITFYEFSEELVRNNPSRSSVTRTQIVYLLLNKFRRNHVYSVCGVVVLGAFLHGKYSTGHNFGAPGQRSHC